MLFVGMWTNLQLVFRGQKINRLLDVKYKAKIKKEVDALLFMIGVDERSTISF